VKKNRQHYRFATDYVTEYHGPLTASFEIDGRVFVTDHATLDLLNQKREHGSLRVAQWLFAVNLATGRIKRTKSDPAVRAD
jgi:hypothetical protein